MTVTDPVFRQPGVGRGTAIIAVGATLFDQKKRGSWPLVGQCEALAEDAGILS